ncbi:ArsA-related P-loop ATPase [Nocardioides mesophilus]|uniref:ArsA-related P-loop ATPase n=1 Tax=Nocardioides mesophilus TaxID=433659 RepID=UPI00248349D3|nr:ArsA-related P-loop ATPase [Nocardioides mesophilus]
MRILLFTGKGGVGKTTTAAGTAALAAGAGLRTLVLSTDAAHSLADAFAVPIGAEPTQLSENLFVQRWTPRHGSSAPGPISRATCSGCSMPPESTRSRPRS